MAQEREIKLRIEDLRVLRRALAKLGALVVTARVHELNVVFDTPEFDLAKHEQLLRIRTETPGASRSRTSGAGTRALVTFKRPVAAAGGASKGERRRHQVREEIELEVTDGKTLARIFEGLGMNAWFRYEKLRTTFRLPASRGWARGLLIDLDETPIGVFLELEGPAAAIDRAARALGFQRRDYVLANYMVLYREYCRSRDEEPRDMLFAKKARRSLRKKARIFRETSFFS
jgi:adenylate cyclase, class 2